MIQLGSKLLVLQNLELRQLGARYLELEIRDGLIGAGRGVGGEHAMMMTTPAVEKHAMETVTVWTREMQQRVVVGVEALEATA